MCDQTEIAYEDGEVVWVKLGPTWWPGQVLEHDKVPQDALKSFRKPPIAVVKFFKEESLEFVKNVNQIYKYNCSRKHEFVKKGLDQYRAKHPNMELFPSYVCEAEVLTHGDPDLIHSEDFKPSQKVDYNAIFSTGVEKKPKPKPTPSKFEDTPKITHPRILQKYLKGTSDYKVHILLQDARNENGTHEEKLELEAEEETMVPPPAPTPPRIPATPGPLSCHACSFTCNRISVMVLHNKIHSAGYVPYTPPKKPKTRLPHSTPKIKLSPKSLSIKKMRGRPKKMSLPDSSHISVSPKPAKSPLKSNSGSVKRKAKEKKELEKPKTDVEIKNSLLADWSESSNDSFDILSSVNLREKPRSVSSRPQTPDSNSEEKVDSSEVVDDTSSKKTVESKKADCFDFDDDDDELAIESIGRKIPRPPIKSDETTKKILDESLETVESNIRVSISVEGEKMDVDLDSKIDNLLQETKLPELPSLPSEAKFVKDKSPLKEDSQDNSKKEASKPQQKTIFKTKTFFRSRHSRSQDAIEKYVADNASIDKPPTYMEEAEQAEIPSDVSPNLTPPSKGSQNKSPKFAPKIQLKKLKAALNEQIKPQAGKSNEERWDNESLDKLINSATDDGLQGMEVKTSSVNDLLGTIEEPLVMAVKQDVPTTIISPTKSDLSEDTSKKDLQIPHENVLEKDKEITNPTRVESEQILSSDVNKTNLLSPGKDDIFEDSSLTIDESKRRPYKAQAKLLASPKKDDMRMSKVFASKPEISPLKESAIQSSIITSPKLEARKPTITNSDDVIDQESAIIEVKSPSKMDVNAELNKAHTQSDLQIAETLINLPTSGAVAQMDYTHNVDDMKMSESDKNISAAKSLVQMSEALQHENSFIVTESPAVAAVSKVTRSPTSPLKQSKSIVSKPFEEKVVENTKLFKILDEPAKPKLITKSVNLKAIENVPNTQGASQTISKPRVIIRKGAPPKDTKQQTLLPSPVKTVLPKEDEALFDINSMPIVLSEEILTPENIQKMPMVVSDVQINPTIDTPPVISEKIIIKEPTVMPFVSSNEVLTSPAKKFTTETKTTIMKSSIEKTNTPNILSKSNKLKTIKHLLVVDKTSGEQKIISSESYDESPPVTITKVIKRSPTILSKSQKPGEKFIILPSSQSPKQIIPSLTKLSRPSPKLLSTTTLPSPGKRTQKIILSSQTGSQIVLEDSATSTNLSDKGKVTTAKAKITQSRGNAEPTGNAFMIITNAQGVQSKIVLTPEHQKVLFSKKPGQLTLTPQPAPQVKSVPSVLPPRAKSIAVTSQSIITSRGQIMNPISGNALITSTGQLLPAQTVSSGSSVNSSKQKGSIISSTKVIPPGERVIITGKPNQAILTSKGQLIMTQMTPTTSQSKISSAPCKFTTSTIISPSVQRTVISKPKQTLVKITPSTVVKSNSKLITGDLATLLQGKKPGTVMHLSAAQFEHLQKTGQIVQQPPLTQIVQTQKGKATPTKIQSQKIIVQKQTPTIKQINPVVEKKTLLPTPASRMIPNLVQSKVSTPPPKKQKLRELLSTEAESSQPKKKKTVVTYPTPTKQSIETPKMVEQSMDLGNLDDLIPATTIATRKGEASAEGTLISPPTAISELPTTTIAESNLPSTSIQPQDPMPADSAQQVTGGLGDGQLLAVPGENFGGPPNSFYLCVEDNGTLTPIDNQPLVLENNQLVPMVIPPVLPEFLNTEDQILVDQQTLLSLLGGSGADRLVTGDNQQLLLQGDVRQLMAALTPQAAPNQDILAAALADTDVFQPDTLVAEGLSVVSGAGQGMLVEMDPLTSDFQTINPAVTVHCNVSETSTTLKQPIMSPMEMPSKKRVTEDISTTESLEDSLAVIGVTTPSIPTSLDLPITVTDPRIAPKATNPLSLSCGPFYSPTPTSLESLESPLLNESKVPDSAFTTTSIDSSIVTQSEDLSGKNEDVVSQHILEKVQSCKKQPASSMPCLDDSSSDSFASDNPQQLTEAIQTKTYSPISMPLLTDDPPLPSEPTPSDGETVLHSTKSMPDLLDSEEGTPSDTPAISTSMPLLDDTQDETHSVTLQDSKIETSVTIPNNVLPNEIFNESITSNEEHPKDSSENADTFTEQINNIEETPQSEELNNYQEEASAMVESEEAPASVSIMEEAQNIEDMPIVETPNDIHTEPVDGIPIIVTTEDGEGGGMVVDVDLDVAPPSVPSPPEGNSLPHAVGEEPFSDASSDASTEIPLQPPISISQHSLTAGRNGDKEKRSASPITISSSPKKFKYDDER